MIKLQWPNAGMRYTPPLLINMVNPSFVDQLYILTMGKRVITKQWPYRTEYWKVGFILYILKFTEQ